LEEFTYQAAEFMPELCIGLSSSKTKELQMPDLEGFVHKFTGERKKGPSRCEGDHHIFSIAWFEDRVYPWLYDYIRYIPTYQGDIGILPWFRQVSTLP